MLVVSRKFSPWTISLIYRPSIYTEHPCHGAAHPTKDWASEACIIILLPFASVILVAMSFLFTRLLRSTFTRYVYVLLSPPSCVQAMITEYRHSSTVLHRLLMAIILSTSTPSNAPMMSHFAFTGKRKPRISLALFVPVYVIMWNNSTVCTKICAR